MGDLKFQLLHYFSEFWKRRWSILAVLWIAGALGALVAASKPDSYTSRSRVYVNTQVLLTKIFGKNLPISDPRADVENVRKFMYARPNIEEVIRKTDIYLDLHSDAEWEAQVASITKKLKLRRQGNDYYLIEFEHSNPRTAYRVVQTVLDLFLEEAQPGAKVGRESEQARRYAETQRADAQAKLDKVEAQIADYERNYPDEISGAPVLSSNMRTLEAELSRLTSEKLLYEQEIGALRARVAAEPQQIQTGTVTPPQPQRQFLPPPNRTKIAIPQGPTAERQAYQSFASRVGQVEAEVQQLLRRFTPQHPDVISAEQRAASVRGELEQYRIRADQADAQLQARIQEALQINAAIDEEYRQWQIQANAPLPVIQPKPVYGPNPAIPELRAQIDQRRSRLTVADARIGEIRGKIAGLQRLLAGQPEILQQYEKLRADRAKYSTLVEEHELALNTLETINDTDLPLQPDFRVVEPPKEPVTPTGPNRLMLFGAAGIGAFASALGLAFLRIQMSDNMPTLSHLKRAFDLPVLGGVSLMETAGQTARGIASALLFLAGVAAFVTLLSYVAYRYQFHLWRPDIGALLGSAQAMI